MRTIGKCFSAVGVAFFVIAVGSAIAQRGPEQTAVTEKEKIEALIQRVVELKDAKFVRNGTAYDAATAAKFLRGKWDANASAIKTAQDFIDKAATASSTSGKPYLIRFNDRREVKSADFLRAELQKIEK